MTIAPTMNISASNTIVTYEFYQSVPLICPLLEANYFMEYRASGNINVHYLYNPLDNCLGNLFFSEEQGKYLPRTKNYGNMRKRR